MLHLTKSSDAVAHDQVYNWWRLSCASDNGLSLLPLRWICMRQPHPLSRASRAPSTWPLSAQMSRLVLPGSTTTSKCRVSCSLEVLILILCSSL